MTHHMQIDALSRSYDAPGHMAKKLHTLVESAADAFCVAFPGAAKTELIQLSLNLEVISGVFGWTTSEFNAPKMHYQNLTPAVPSLIDVGELEGKIDWYQKKLYGQRWNHFGAFLGPVTREHDWLWGRIDGASQLSTRLLKYGDVSKDDAKVLQDELIEALLASENNCTEDDVVAQALNAYESTAQSMLADMYRSDGGRSIQSLIRTCCALLGSKGRADQIGRWGWIAFAPDWPPKDGPKESIRVRFLGRCLRVLTRGMRRRFLHAAVGPVAEHISEPDHSAAPISPTHPHVEQTSSSVPDDTTVTTSHSD